MADAGHPHPRQKFPGEMSTRKQIGATEYLQQDCPKRLRFTPQTHFVIPTSHQTGPPQKSHPKQEPPKARPHHTHPQQTSCAQIAVTEPHNQPPKKAPADMKTARPRKAQVSIPPLQSPCYPQGHTLLNKE